MTKNHFDKDPNGMSPGPDEYSQRLAGARRMQDQCPECFGHGFTKAEVYLMPSHAMARMAADPILAKQPIPIHKTECKRCAGSGKIWLGR